MVPDFGKTRYVIWDNGNISQHVWSSFFSLNLFLTTCFKGLTIFIKFLSKSIMSVVLHKKLIRGPHVKVQPHAAGYVVGRIIN